MARSSRFAFLLILITDDGRRFYVTKTYGRYERLDLWDAYNIGTDLGRDIEFQSALVDSVRSVDTADKEDIIKWGVLIEP